MPSTLSSVRIWRSIGSATASAICSDDAPGLVATTATAGSDTEGMSSWRRMLIDTTPSTAMTTQTSAMNERFFKLSRGKRFTGAFRGDASIRAVSCEPHTRGFPSNIVTVAHKPPRSSNRRIARWQISRNPVPSAARCCGGRLRTSAATDAAGSDRAARARPCPLVLKTSTTRPTCPPTPRRTQSLPAREQSRLHVDSHPLLSSSSSERQRACRDASRPSAAVVRENGVFKVVE